MRERAVLLTRVACMVLAGLVLLQLIQMARRTNPLPASLTSTALGGQRAGHATNASPALMTNLPPTIQASVERITSSEVFGPVPRPAVVPLALLGIAGDEVFLRSPSGQTGMARQGEEFAGIKVLQIGTNRVLVEQDGAKKELTIFAGFGSAPLLPQGKEKTP
jgi:hypothetical protein